MVFGYIYIMDIQFLKMHGLGNDFVILDARKEGIPTDENFMRHIAHRRFGIGCDQIAVLYPSDSADIFMGIYNGDGSEVAACGNMTRCVASLIMQEQGTDTCTIETLAGVLACDIDTEFSDTGDFIRVDMGDYKTDWADIPLSHACDTTAVPISYNGTDYTGFCVNMGNPHFVCMVPDCETVDLPTLGAYIEHHAIFPECTNVEFVTVKSDTHVRMRVWERGRGVTMACGSGACAVAVACYTQGLTKDTVKMTVDGGDLYICVRPDKRVYMIGGYTTVFKGTLTYEFSNG